MNDVLLPIAHAQIDPSQQSPDITISGIFQRLTEILNLVIPFLVLVATVVFIWGIVKYITAGSDEKRLGEARNIVIWGIIALAAMLAVWGLVYVLLNAVFGDAELPPIPGVDIEPFL